MLFYRSPIGVVPSLVGPHENLRPYDLPEGERYKCDSYVQGYSKLNTSVAMQSFTSTSLVGGTNGTFLGDIQFMNGAG